ncbi:Glycosyl transferase family 2 [Algoriphagus alkaliphilus]|uniref:Glycosyl transferase family 2 n=1 Tax=Algoriphagus alkaliphilus TaxID=279824 RepID=A0A1G5ZNC6_9BACT|nr:glycosyltransferase family 2 protein [Algoriphagus alkaliphilus]SDA96358.1 Glycosyl transferase family 2 [Algoriphagus alkaliphilus]
MLVSVIIPVYNCQRFLKNSIKSILDQSFKDFELICVDDGSTDNSTDIIRSFSDPRIKLLEHGINKGIFEALNTGIDVSCGDLIFRMDADDVATSNRIALQVDYMRNNPRIGISGTLAQFFDGNLLNKPVSNEYLKPSLLLDCPFVHPTVVIRREVLIKNQLKFSGYLEDYELWVKLSQVTEFGLLPEVLLKYRQSENQFTAQNFERREKEADLLRVRFAEQWLNRKLTSEEISIVILGTLPSKQPELKLVESFCKELINNNSWGSKQATLEVVKKLFFRNYFRSKESGRISFTVLKSSLLSVREKFNLLRKSKFSLS